MNVIFHPCETVFRYEKLSQSKFKLYTRILVRLPPAAPVTKNWSHLLKTELQQGISMARLSVNVVKNFVGGTLQYGEETRKEENLIY